MVITDAYSVILQVNQAFITTTGYSNEALGQTRTLIQRRIATTPLSSDVEHHQQHSAWKG
jgi:PAS domain-containing protein